MELFRGIRCPTSDAALKDFLNVPYRAGFQTIYFNNYKIVGRIELRVNSSLPVGAAFINGMVVQPDGKVLLGGEN